MILRFNDAPSYEIFQFIWIALSKTSLQINAVNRLMLLHHLHEKLVAVSHETPEGGRLLNKDCELEFTADEQVLLLECFANTNWKPEVFYMVRRACVYLGAEFEEPNGPRNAQVH